MENSRYNAVGWFEIYVNDIERAKKFYETVFQVELTTLSDPTDQNLKMEAFPFSMESLPGASGSLVQMEGFSAGKNSVIIYFTSTDCSIEAARAEQAGGKILKPKMSIGEHGFMSLVYDTEENIIGIHSMA